MTKFLSILAVVGGQPGSFASIIHPRKQTSILEPGMEGFLLTDRMIYF
jgi:hypothetical protein